MMRVTAPLFFGLALLLHAQIAPQAPEQKPTMAGAASQMALRISSLLPRRSAISLDWQNLTERPPAEWSSFQSELRDALHQAGIRTEAAPPDSRVHVTLSENPRGLLFVAEVFTGDNRQIAMLPWSASASAAAKPTIRISQSPLWRGPQPILDVLEVDASSELLVLTNDELTAYRQMNEKWTPVATASLVLPRPMPRDPRGRLLVTAGGFQVFLPVATCTGSWNPELKLTCASGTPNWPGTSGTHWLADRNTLEGDPLSASYPGWGSDWVSIADPCGAGTIVIASSSNNERDQVRAYEIVNGQASPASDAMPVSGPITALWPAGSGREATLVVHNLQSGEYESSRLLLACVE